MARTAIKVGQKITLSQEDGRRTVLRNIPSHDATHASVLCGNPRVQVLKISFNRRELKANAVWIRVQSVTDPTQIGWIPFDCGGWENGARIEIGSIVFSVPEALAKSDVKCG